MPTTYQQLIAQTASKEQQINLIAGALAVGSGFVALYLGSGTWGGPRDYVSAVLWGSVVSQGLSQLSQFAGRLKLPLVGG
jgi:hypothetical protein